MSVKRLEKEVINRIAAGEVIHRPASALKELIENSLDAKSKKISITLKDGGLKVLQVQDDGSGIRLEDYEILCERFTTSKLTKYEDLQSIQTFGFRGEALASLTHVAHVTITSMTAGSTCAYKACYSDGKLVPPPGGNSNQPRACAGVKGTIICGEDLFYNVPVRKQALKSPSDEYNKCLDVVTKYAVHYPGVGFSCKKQGAAGFDMVTSPSASQLDNIKNLHSKQTAKELIEITGESKELETKVHGWISNANFNLRKLTFILFINNRLVQSNAIRKAIETDVYGKYLPKQTHPWIYLAVDIAPANVDVNVHPTKQEVHFLHEEKIIDFIKDIFERYLGNANSSRTFYTQGLLGSSNNISDDVSSSSSSSGSNSKSTSSSSSSSSSNKSSENKNKNIDYSEKSPHQSEKPHHNPNNNNTSNKPKYVPQQLVRTDSATGSMEAYITVGGNKNNTTNRLPPKFNNNNDDEDEDIEVVIGGKTSTKSNGNSKRPANQNINIDDDDGGMEKGKGGGKEGGIAQQLRKRRKPVLLTSVQALQQQCREEAHHALTEIFKSCIYVGMADQHRPGSGGGTMCLIQHNTKLYLVDVVKLSRAYMYQEILGAFSSMGRIQIVPPASISALVEVALDCPEAGLKPEDTRDKSAIKDYAVSLLISKASLLSEYFSVDISETGELEAIPEVLIGSTPGLVYLPLLLLRMALHVDWDTEEGCFRTVTRELAKFYAIQPAEYYLDPTLPSSSSSSSSSEPAAWSHDVGKIIGEKLLPAVRSGLFFPPKKFTTDGTVTQLACLENLYKIFERC